MLNRGVTGGILGSFSSSLKKGQTYHCDIMSTQEVGIFPVSCCSFLFVHCSLLLALYSLVLLFAICSLSVIFCFPLFALYSLLVTFCFLFSVLFFQQLVFLSLVVVFSSQLICQLVFSLLPFSLTFFTKIFVLFFKFYFNVNKCQQLLQNRCQKLIVFLWSVFEQSNVKLQT